MNLRFPAIAFIAIIAISTTGCGIGRAMMSPFHSSEPTPAANTSDVIHPGRPLPAPSPSPPRQIATKKSVQRSASVTPRPTTTKTNASVASAQFPVAKPVPGKPGLVFNPFKTNGGYIDVSGYAPGSKVKDPESQKIFVVP
jgi:hypothetical protein